MSVFEFHRRPRAVFHLSALLLALCAPPTPAAEVPWRPEPIERVYEQKDLRELIRELAAAQGISASVDKEVTGTVYGKFNLPAAKLFQYLVSTHGLIYYYAGNVLHVYPASAAVSEVIPLKRADPAQFMRSLADMGISDDRYPVALNRRERTLVVSGPRRYVEMVKQLAQSADENETGRNNTVTRLFRLRYAWARDQTVGQGGQQAVIPGVASVLQRLFPASAPPATPRAAGRLATAVAQEPVNRRVRNTELELRLPPRLPKPEEFAEPEAPPPGTANGHSAGFPVFTAEARLNAVLIRDLPERMPLYEELIQELDVRPKLVEIEATIIEVGSENLSALGIDWRFNSSKVDLRSGRNDLPQQRWPAPPLPTAPGVVNTLPGAGAVASAGAVLTTILTDGGRQLVARVNALEQDGKASFRAAPKVLTLDNVEAKVERLRTFFVRVPGTYQTDLYDVSVGTSMRVTPLVVPEGADRRVKLSVRIDDGEITDERVDQIPVITRNAIGTEAFVGDGESLLLAGYTEEIKREMESGVPGLSKLPVVGHLFKQRDKTGGRVERLFLITPRLVALPEPPGPTGSSSHAR